MVFRTILQKNLKEIQVYTYFFVVITTSTTLSTQYNIEYQIQQKARQVYSIKYVQEYLWKLKMDSRKRKKCILKIAFLLPFDCSC
jgi:hypothetical protein